MELDTNTHFEIAVGGESKSTAAAAEVFAHGRNEADLTGRSSHLPSLQPPTTKNIHSFVVFIRHPT